MTEDFLHKWANVIQHYKNIRIREEAVMDLLNQNQDSYRMIEEEMNHLLAMYKFHDAT